MANVPEEWRFSFDDEEVGLRDLSWPEAVRFFRSADARDLAAQADGQCVSLEFNTIHAAAQHKGPFPFRICLSG